MNFVVMSCLRALALAATCAIALASATLAHAQPQLVTHSSGEMAISADGRLVAFSVLGQPANQFILFDTTDKHGYVVDTPRPYVGELTWSPDGDELTFVTAEGHTIGGEGRHVWRLTPKPDGPVVELLAIIPFVRSAALSADGTRLATFEGVIAGDDPYSLGNIAYAIFERTLLDGREQRRSEGYANPVADLQYDRQGALYFRI